MWKCRRSSRQWEQPFKTSAGSFVSSRSDESITLMLLLLVHTHFRTALEPPSLLPHPGSIDRAVPDLVLVHAVKQMVDPLKVDRLEDPPVEPGIDVLLPILLHNGRGDGEDGDAAVGARLVGQDLRPGRGVLEFADHPGGADAVDDWHLEGRQYSLFHRLDLGS